MKWLGCSTDVGVEAMRWTLSDGKGCMQTTMVLPKGAGQGLGAHMGAWCAQHSHVARGLPGLGAGCNSFPAPALPRPARFSPKPSNLSRMQGSPMAPGSTLARRCV